MRIYLAVQVISETMLRLIENNAQFCKGIERYSSIVEIIKKVDRLVDICNGTDMSKQKVWKGCECINSPTHKHL